MKKNFLTLTFITITFISFSQHQNKYSESFQTLYSTVFDGDTIAIMNLGDISVIRYKFTDTREEFLYNSTKRKIEKVMPYYDIALKVLDDLKETEDTTTKRQFKKYKRSTKKQLMNKFEKELRELTMSEGKILVKLINRNTGSSFNDLLKEYNNPVKVWAYNIVAKKYGYQLKEDYKSDADENKYIEMALKALNF